MATTFINFVPSQITAPQFNLTLDGNVYTATVTWNLSRQDYYITITSLEGAIIVMEALVGSPIGVNIASIVWTPNGLVTVTTSAPHGMRFGRTLPVTIAGVVPAAFNGQVQAYITGMSTFTFPLAANPGLATALGAVQRNINLVAGFFDTTLVYRVDNSQFEVTPPNAA
jgi:hypothetical protein